MKMRQSPNENETYQKFKWDFIYNCSYLWTKQLQNGNETLVRCKWEYPPNEHETYVRCKWDFIYNCLKFSNETIAKWKWENY